MKQPENKDEGTDNRTQVTLGAIREKFMHFHVLLERNHQVLEVISDMEEKDQGEFLFDLNYIRDRITTLREGVREIVECMIAIGGERYRPLQERLELIDSEIEIAFPGNRPIREDAFTRRFEKLGRMHSFSVGSKNAQLGEMKSRLHLPVPAGFAITAWAYKHFIDANDLQRRISKCIESLDIRSFDDLARVSGEIREMVMTSPIPDDLADAIEQSCRELAERSSTNRFSLRSSAIGEDTIFSFAGQYASYLNVRSDELIDSYREVLASKFTPQAIYYFLSHSLSESELAMSVGCVAMIDARAAGVVYTRCPVNPKDDDVLVNSVYGLGKYLVDGTITPDVFRVSRQDRKAVETQISVKPVQCRMSPDGGTVEEKVPKRMQSQPSLSEEQVATLTEYAIRLEEHYGLPQDIEWAINGSGEIYLLQTRPLQVMTVRENAVLPDLSQMETIVTGGTTVCHGAGGGRIHHVASAYDLGGVPDEAVLVATNPFPGLITVMGKINALVTRVGGMASHMATIAREFKIPTLVGVHEAPSLPQGRMVTVDATGTVIYAGEQPELIAAREPEYELLSDESIFDVLGRVLDLISPMRLLNPGDDDFVVGNCVTFHDITRFAHQKAMEEMFYGATDFGGKETVSLELKTDMPLQVNIIYIDRDMKIAEGARMISDDELDSEPMVSFWEGVKAQGWPKTGVAPRARAAREAMGTTVTDHTRHEYSENSFAILGREYMVLSLRMGYHFTTVEAMCSPRMSKNYIRMQFNHGGAPLERRARRITLITTILRRMDFECHTKGDFFDGTVSYKDAETIKEKLFLLGRLVLMTKQLDMALSSDGVAEWYTKDFIKQLGLDRGDETRR